jgi:hypothetical protein
VVVEGTQRAREGMTVNVTNYVAPQAAAPAK